MPTCQIDPGFAKPREGQVDAAASRVFPDVTRDVGELHCDAEIARAREHLRIARAHHDRHHRADGPRDARRVCVESVQCFVAKAACVPREPV